MAAASDAFPDLQKRNRCIGILIAASGAAAIIGVPILTGIASLTNWRWAIAALLLPLAAMEVGVMILPRRQLKAEATFLADYLSRNQRVLHHSETTWILLASLVRNIIWTAPIIYSVAIWVDGFHICCGSIAGYS